MAKDDALKWAQKQEEQMLLGAEQVADASNDALEYLIDVVENIRDKKWREMAVEQQAYEMGVGEVFAENLIPEIYNDMGKRLRKTLKKSGLKLNQSETMMLRRIYIGRVVKNIGRMLNERDNKAAEASTT